jgi:hypothetical protein
MPVVPSTTMLSMMLVRPSLAVMLALAAALSCACAGEGGRQQRGDDSAFHGKLS